MNRIKQLWRGVSPWGAVTVHPSSRAKRYRFFLNESDVVRIGEQSVIECKIMSDRAGIDVQIGNRTFIGASLLVAAEKIVIGNDILISWGVTIVDHDSHNLDWEYRQHDVVQWGRGEKNWDHVTIRPVTICDKVWIGFGASILKGITVGEGAIVAANSVVTKDVAPWTVVAGNPARIVRQLKKPGE
ncbi:acyltransferase [Blastomonas sp. AAP53]|uniref:acyltransferase n=1 Tax=Blastomonas sp. AAP53 TaxID=1248760 RepID=UPI001930AB24|nr:acyltransferase [Blastomonas sp. AAP53]